MTAVLTMPRMGETMESGRVATWLKKPGDSFKRGETILEIETDKVTVEMPALDDGRLVEIIAAEGTEVAVGAALGRYDQTKAGALAPTSRPPEPAPVLPTLTATPLTLPRMGETMEEGRIVAWLKQPGQTFKRGEVLVEIETDKTTVEVPALDDGQLLDIVAQAGASVAVGEPIGHYAPVGGPAARTVPDSSPPQPPTGTSLAAAPSAGSDAAREVVGQASPANAGSRLRATPLARRLARNGGLDLRTLTGSGRRGRIEKRDIEAVLAGREAGPALKSETSTPGVLFLDLPDGRLAYRDWEPAGAARGTVLFLHGFSADGATWAGFASMLSRQGLRVVAPDLPSHGATTIVAETPNTMAAPVLALIDALALEDCHVVGHSMGAAVAVMAAEGLVSVRMTLIAPAGLGSEIDADFVTGMAHARTYGALSHLLRRLARRVPPMSRSQLDRLVADVARGRLKRLAESLVEDGRQAIDILSELRALKGQVRIVWGVEDRIIPWTQVTEVPSVIPIHLITGAGHMPHWDNPQDLAALFT
ncbi:acetoin dehydrogenase dihydrolipoyllysine-residue acetyltransferase subunit [Lichenihabitans psoromatis]|uniref:acetoin dehydrogenase dihydrolipoyllysine-residue acetyltransferase subunit n=1 Tax=Lichenihabitans psoromatis TaxID=2528642 RepID=UPI0010384EDD|nr:acetoin dehydrogenase dihydrolipoyllysine-residue acetyltransferase subunit [Lichenihabitans psoromatis]